MAAVSDAMIMVDWQLMPPLARRRPKSWRAFVGRGAAGGRRISRHAVKFPTMTVPGSYYRDDARETPAPAAGTTPAQRKCIVLKLLCLSGTRVATALAAASHNGIVAKLVTGASRRYHILAQKGATKAASAQRAEVDVCSSSLAYRLIRCRHDDEYSRQYYA